MSDSSSPLSLSLRVTAAGKFLQLDGEPWLLKGVAYGPFDGDDSLPSPDQVGRDLRQIAALGCNTLRIYMPPPRWFLEACAAAGIRLLIGWPWPLHTDFLRTRRGAAAIIKTARDVVRSLRGAPAVLGFLVGNEIPADMVRWMGPARVQRFLERVIATCRDEAPEALFGYASYPSTEYLNPRNADFVSCNIYLDDRAALARYLMRLQHVTGDRPLVIGEFGMDTHSYGAARQAEVVAGAWVEMMRAGLAGQVIFSFTDEWFNDGRRLDGDWAFGITMADRTPRAAAVALAAILPPVTRPGQGVQLKVRPRFSIIICTYNGSRTLRNALQSVLALPYSDYEIVLVDDGSTDPEVAVIAASYRDVRSFRITHGGLSKARNFGARQASGTILVYLDDDAAATSDWLTYLALAFEDERVGAAGGPNIPPPARSLLEAAIAAAPGGPAAVLINDTEAEHIPGCNLAVTRAAWEEVGGFDERHRTAGDDVDICWRLLDHGYRISYHAGAMVWHERRQTVRSYFRQQYGYGSAEADLMAQHRHRFSALGGARWRGVIYEPSTRRTLAAGIIYGGMFGTAPYQFLYAVPRSVAEGWFTSASCGALGFFFLMASVWQTWFLVVALVLLVPPAWLAARTAVLTAGGLAWPGGAVVGRLHARLIIFLLVLAQPWVRGLARGLGCLRHRVLPAGPWRRWPWFHGWPAGRPKVVAELAFWGEQRGSRTELLTAVLHELERVGWPVMTGDQWSNWDLELKRSRWWLIRLVTATEYHPSDRRLTRVRLHTRATGRTLAAAAVTTAVVLTVFLRHASWGVWGLAGSFLLWLVLEYAHGAATSRLLRLVLAAARKLGLQQLDPATSRPASPPIKT